MHRRHPGTVPSLRTIASRTALCAALCSVLSGSVRAAAGDDSLHIVIVGSSTAAGQGVSKKDSAWVPRFERWLRAQVPGARVTNLAKRGYSTCQCQPDWFVPPPGRPPIDPERNISRAIALHPSAIILSLPSNDLSGDMPLEEIEANFDRMIGEAATACIPVWITTTQPRDLTPERRLLLSVLRDWIHFRFAPHVLDFWTGFAMPDGRIERAFDAGDGIHFNNRGHAQLFERVRAAGIPARLADLGVIASLDEKDQEFQLTPASHPFFSRAPLRVLLRKPATVTVTAYDLRTFRTIASMTRDLFPGTNDIRLPLGAVPPGLVLWQIDDGHTVTTGVFAREHY
jgi:lysophospholipase L1-like esterase